MATQNSTLRGNCVAPFLDASRFPQHEGFVDGRLCAKIEGLDGAPTCCLPCPASAWAYSDRFETYNTASEWLNVVGFALLCFMLISYIVLPAQQTRSHYLSVCLIISVMMITLGFTVPLAARPEQCYNEITPNDMYTSMSCAWGGAFIVAGGLSVVMWVLIRALSMNLQICWDIVPGRRFFYVSLMFGWGIPAVLFLLTITLTGVSFRFGSACHVNHAHSMGDFWGPLTAMAGIAGVLQIMTLVYCGHVYMRNLWSDEPDPSTATSEGLPSYQGSTHTKTARAVYRRLKRVLWLQWRGICIVTIILVDIIFFTVVFIRMDTMQNGAKNNYAKVVPWLACLASNPTDKNQCLHLVNDFVVAEPAVAAVLFMLGFAGFEVFFLLTRPSIFPAWLDFFRSFGRPKRQAFVTLDATPPDLTRSTSHSGLVDSKAEYQSTTYEMSTNTPRLHAKELDVQPASESALSSPQSTYQTPLHRGQSPALMTYATHHRPGYQRESSNDWANNHVYELSDRNGDEGRQYQRPMTSFSRPAAPARVSFSEPGGTLARGGLGQNPPSEASESRENSGHVRAASKNAPKLRLHHYERNGRI